MASPLLAHPPNSIVYWKSTRESTWWNWNWFFGKSRHLLLFSRSWTNRPLDGTGVRIPPDTNNNKVTWAQSTLDNFERIFFWLDNIFGEHFHSVRYGRLTKADSLVTQVNDFIMILSFHQARSSSQKWPNEVKISFLRAQTKNDKQKATVNETKMATWTRTNVNWLRKRLRPQRSFHQKLLLLPPVGHIKTATATTFSVGQQTSSRADAVC